MRMDGAGGRLKHSGEVGKHGISVVGIFNRKLALLDDGVEIKKHVSFLFSPSDEDLHWRPIAGRFCVEPAVWGL